MEFITKFKYSFSREMGPITIGNNYSFKYLKVVSTYLEKMIIGWIDKK